MGSLLLCKVTGHHIQLDLKLLLFEILLVKSTEELKIFLVVFLVCILHKYTF